MPLHVQSVILMGLMHVVSRQHQRHLCISPNCMVRCRKNQPTLPLCLHCWTISALQQPSPPQVPVSSVLWSAAHSRRHSLRIGWPVHGISLVLSTSLLPSLPRRRISRCAGSSSSSDFHPQRRGHLSQLRRWPTSCAMLLPDI